MRDPEQQPAALRVDLHAGGTLIPPPTPQNGRLLFVDGLRGLAAAWVVLYHAHSAGHIPQLARALPRPLVWGLFEQGAQGVAIFFALSGFVIAHSLRRCRIDAAFFCRFTLRRGLRLDPVYFAAIAVFLISSFVSARFHGAAFAWPSVGRLLTHFVYLQTILGYEQISVVYWTLCLEIQFYLVYCAAEGILQRLTKRVGQKLANLLVFVPLTAVALLWGTSLMQTSLWPGLFVTHWHGFLLGVLAHFTWTRRFPPQIFWTFAGTILAAAIFRRSAFNLLAALTAMGLVLAGRWGSFGQWLSSRPWQILGRFSYSLYLIHNPVSGAAFFVVYALFGATLLTESLALLVVFLSCVAVAGLFWWLVERPCLRLSRKIRLAPRAEKQELPVSALSGSFPQG